ncbi:MAG: ribonucleoside-diphosphate reductase beta chain, partial [Thermoleophilaceae bacterium]|nr:ribonucleoside-diphosphate reductase beta chain [Thermoleophilaceae bacterium]
DMADTATAQRQAIDSVSYGDLYRRWENGNWKATELDFTQDRKDWHETFGDLERRAALWNYSMFFHGEDSVTDNLSPYIDAAPREEQKYFLATQQVDEARHAVFFARFMREVVERGDTIAHALDATAPELTWGFRKTFAYLDKVADGLRKDRSKPNFAAAITMYHLVVEATLAQPGQHFIEGYLEERGVLPGFYAGMQNVSKDEQRHIGFGVKCLSDLVKEDPECKYAVADLLRDVMPLSIGVFIPPNWDRRYVEIFGSTIEDVYLQGMQSFESKMRAAGLPLEDLPGAPPLPIDLPPEERVHRAIAMLQAGFLGEKTGPPSRDPQKVQLLFDTIGRSVDTDATPNGAATIQWEFKDADPWFLRIDNGSTRTEQGRYPSPDLTLRCAFEDWIDITAGREDPRVAMLKGKLRPRGSIRMLMRMPKLFGR